MIACCRYVGPPVSFYESVSWDFYREVVQCEAIISGSAESEFCAVVIATGSERARSSKPGLAVSSQSGRNAGN
jgi:hypothetical protein